MFSADFAHGGQAGETRPSAKSRKKNRAKEEPPRTVSRGGPVRCFRRQSPGVTCTTNEHDLPLPSFALTVIVARPVKFAATLTA